MRQSACWMQTANEITSSEIRKNVDSVKVTVPILETKEVTISASAIGEPADG